MTESEKGPEGQKTRQLDYQRRSSDIKADSRRGLVKTIIGSAMITLALVIVGAVSVKSFLVADYSIPAQAPVILIVLFGLGMWSIDPKETTKLAKWLSKFVPRFGGGK